MGGLTDRAKSDWKKFSSDLDGWGTTINFEAPTAETADIVGLASKHHISVDSEGNPMNAKNAHISVSEELLVAAGYPTRNAKAEVDLIGHRIDYVDSTGVLKMYRVQQNFADETIGLITCILEDFE